MGFLCFSSTLSQETDYGQYTGKYIDRSTKHSEMPVTFLGDCKIKYQVK